MPIPPALSVKQPSIAPAPQFGAKKPPSLVKAAVLGVSLFLGGAAANASTAEKPGIITSGGDTFALTVKDESDVYDDSVNSVNRGANANKYKRLLRNRPSPVADPNMFLPTLFPTATNEFPDTSGPSLTLKQTRKKVKQYMKKEFPSDPIAQKEAMDLFNSRKARARIPNVSLRATMVGMKGTRKGEPAIDHILNAKMPDGSPRVKIVGFGLPEEWVGDSADARTIIDPSTQQQIIVFNPMNRSADPFQLSNHLYHETLHWDLTNSKTEETVIKSLQEPMYLEQLVNHPEMARDPSRIARRNNSNAYARLMGGVNGKIGVFESEHPNEPLLPGSGIPATTLLELIGKIL